MSLPRRAAASHCWHCECAATCGPREAGDAMKRGGKAVVLPSAAVWFRRHRPPNRCPRTLATNIARTPCRTCTQQDEQYIKPARQFVSMNACCPHGTSCRAAYRRRRRLLAGGRRTPKKLVRRSARRQTERCAGDVPRKTAASTCEPQNAGVDAVRSKQDMTVTRLTWTWSCRVHGGGYARPLKRRNENEPRLASLVVTAMTC